ncbi:tagatose 1,6-diphosphate aldolase (plasmid) [Parasedimentitalea marina]|uniref:Tagatose 1,6-diphosphate aldolase n=1 Tax=Parasedimentitalea marina TaxID=2483033 RepID=A0A3T0N9S6_9RHOB|nr:tagatose 1,6-diphosphate aldolase [Parasedimentitalea marina]AZV80804.1 tagatose 1,6-diphosphate aldolase [Parasedimentitalea marina]
MTQVSSILDSLVYGVAVDQGSGLEAAIKQARGSAFRDDDLLNFKRIVVETLSPNATTLLVDSNYGPDLLESYSVSCTKMLAYEADVYRISDEDRITALPENLRVSDFPKLNAEILKFFLYFGPNDPAALNQKKFDLVQDVSRECKANGLTFLFEPIVYDRALPDGTSAEFARAKPELVRAATKTFADPKFGVDILKVEIPVNFNFVEGHGGSQMSRIEAEAAFVTAAEAAGDVPLLYLSAGVTFDQFRDALAFSRQAGVRSLGFMCGRAIWSDAIDIFGASGPAAMAKWMETVGRDRLSHLKDAIA